MVIRIYTGRYADMKNILYKMKDVDVIGISRFKPKYFKGKIYKDLAPSQNLLSSYKSHQIGEEKFEELYRKSVLSRLTPSQVAYDLNNKVLLCYEDKNKFCHRHIIAKWLKETIGVDVHEVNI